MSFTIHKSKEPVKLTRVMNRATIFCISVLFLLISCEEPTTPNGENGEAGPCVHRYEDPILLVESVTDANNGNQISEIHISDIYIDSTQVEPSKLVSDSTYWDDSSKNISVEDSTIICNPPCGFGTQDGNYRFTTSATDYQDTTLTKGSVEYANFNGGCPSTNSGSTTMSFEMKPQQ